MNDNESYYPHYIGMDDEPIYVVYDDVYDDTKEWKSS